MIIETIIGSMTVVVVSCLIFADRVLKREAILDEPLNDKSEEKLLPFPETSGCHICGQPFNCMIERTAKNGILYWKCKECSGEYKTKAKS